MLNTEQAAEILEVTARRVRQFINDEKLIAEKFGRDWMIEPESVRALKEERKQKKKEREHAANNDT